jgi:hypothetical protein
LAYGLLEVGFSLEGIGVEISRGHLIPLIHHRVVHALALGDLSPCHLPGPVKISLGLEDPGNGDICESLNVVGMFNDGEGMIQFF